MEYKVMKGDTLSGIASKYGLKWQDIYNINKSTIGSNPNLIHPGMTFNLGQTGTSAPGGATSATPTGAPAGTPTGAPLSYAEQARQSILNQLGGLGNQQQDLYNQQLSDAERRKQELLGQIEQQRLPVEQQYGDNTRQAFINKQMGGQQLEGQLGRMGLSNSGFGVGQQMGLETGYAQNLSGLQRSRDDLMQGITQAGTQAESEHANILSQLGMDYSQRQMDLERYMSEQGQRAYDTAYDREFSERQFEWQKKHSAAQLAASRSSGGSGEDLSNFNYQGLYVGPPVKDGKNPYGTLWEGFTADKNTTDAKKKYSTFSNGYQPKGVITMQGDFGTVKSTGKKVADIFGKGVVTNEARNLTLDNQNIWQTHDGKTWVWDGYADRYMDVSSYYKASNFLDRFKR